MLLQQIKSIQHKIECPLDLQILIRRIIIIGTLFNRILKVAIIEIMTHMVKDNMYSFSSNATQMSIDMRNFILSMYT